MFAVDSNGNRASTAKRESLEQDSHQKDSLEKDPPELNVVEPATRLTTLLETIYRDAAIKPSPLGYDILKTSEMANSPRLAGMSQDFKRNALLMALQAAGVELNSIIADAISRQRALNDYEDNLLKELREFEAEKTKESTRLQTELDRLTAECKARLQANLEEVAKEQAAFHAWQQTRQQESQRIVGTAMLLVPPDTASGGDSLAALLDRATPARK